MRVEPSSTLTLSRAQPGERKENMNEVKILERLNYWPRAALGWLAIMTPEDAVESALYESQQGCASYRVVHYSESVKAPMDQSKDGSHA